ncbi:MAG TPA: rubrerythrin family protein [Planctomycetota bacterium]|jgi:rubrerythrin
METEKNLQAAFAGESQANRKYLAFAKKAEEEKRPQIAKLFRAAAAAETIHAHSHLRVLKGVKSTAENLQEAVEGEAFEFQKMYPEFLAKAKAENNRPAMVSFEYAMEVEKVHHALYSEAAQTLATGKDLPAKDIFVCEVCGHTHVGEAPDECPVCGAKKSRFSKVD